ncbi:TonB-dependent receptor domain-containing protein [Ectopseudomonas guguanensis]|uniref:TonB-dependent receptor domain-containing protein n=1 Tax=Ectopseudomonas guguanensis TaxID=1198456 RepID=UPI0012D64D85|nr:MULTISPECIES: TonB-dependent receptor [Pseudomonas]MPT19121.1 TonB-dependent receptor [Pseudomonas sp.]WJH58804.1 TonB-dependent receptor [Pseudomonas guguanensis]
MKLSRLALAIAVLPGLATAAEPYVTEPLVVTSGRLAEPQAQATAATTVFERDDIERLQASSVPDLLSRVPGVSIVQNGGRGSLTSLFLRGANANQTLVLVDGVRLNAAASGLARLEFLSPEQIERIEVVRGPRSALYGADAIGGVIQIFTRQGKAGLQPRLRLAAGSQQSFERSLGLSGGDQHTRFDLGASLAERAGFDRSQDARGNDGDHDGLRRKSFNLSLEHRFSERLKGGLSLVDQRGESEYDELFSFEPGNPSERFSVSTAAAHLEAQLAERWSSRLELGHSEDKSDNRDPLNADNNYSFNTYRDSAAWLNTLHLDEANQLLLGLDWFEDRLSTDSDFSQSERWNQAAFVQHRHRGDGFATELGLRHDKNEQFGSENTWNAALSLDLAERLELLLSYGEGFHAPTFNDLYYPTSAFYGGNPNLAPERSKTYEAQLRGDHLSTRWSLSAYRTEVEDLITVVSDPVTFFSTPMNVNQARLQGLELSLEREVLGWQAVLGASLLDPRDRDSGHTLPRRAKRSLSLDLDRQFGAFAAGITWQAFSGRYDDAANTREIAGYGLLGARASWRMSDELLWQIKVDNILDKDYSQALYSRPNDPFFSSVNYYGYREEGRSALLSLSWTPQL